MKKGISQEVLKLIACATMLLDHIGAVFYPDQIWLRVVGRIAFPIYCFLLVQGAAHTRNPRRYALRLVIGMVLSEFSFDYLFFGGFTWANQSVMVTLLIGFGMLVWMQRMKKWGRILPLAVCFLAAELCNTDYGGWGVAMIWAFAVTGDKPIGWAIRGAAMALIFWLMDTGNIWFGPVGIPIQMFALLALVPIALYSGRKLTRSKAVQVGFYLFYPVHLTILLAIAGIMK